MWDKEKEKGRTDLPAKWTHAEFLELVYDLIFQIRLWRIRSCFGTTTMNCQTDHCCRLVDHLSNWKMIWSGTSAASRVSKRFWKISRRQKSPRGSWKVVCLPVVWIIVSMGWSRLLWQCDTSIVTTVISTNLTQSSRRYMNLWSRTSNTRSVASLAMSICVRHARTNGTG